MIRRYLYPAIAAAFSASLAFGGWQYIRAERLTEKAARFDTCKEVEALKNGASKATDDDLINSLSDGL